MHIEQVKVEVSGYKVVNGSKVYTLLQKKGNEKAMEMINAFFEHFKILSIDNVEIKKNVEVYTKKKPEIAGLPSMIERRYAILHYIPTEFGIKDIISHFGKIGYNEKKVEDNAYHDIKALLDTKRIEEIPGNKPKKYKVIDDTPLATESEWMKSLKEGNKILMNG